MFYRNSIYYTFYCYLSEVCIVLLVTLHIISKLDRVNTGTILCFYRVAMWLHWSSYAATLTEKLLQGNISTTSKPAKQEEKLWRTTISFVLLSCWDKSMYNTSVQDTTDYKSTNPVYATWAFIIVFKRLLAQGTTVRFVLLSCELRWNHY